MPILERDCSFFPPKILKSPAALEDYIVSKHDPCTSSISTKIQQTPLKERVPFLLNHTKAIVQIIDAAERTYFPQMVSRQVIKKTCESYKKGQVDNLENIASCTLFKNLTIESALADKFFKEGVWVLPTQATEKMLLHTPATQSTTVQLSTPFQTVANLLYRKQGDMVENWLAKYDIEKVFHYEGGKLRPTIKHLHSALDLLVVYGDELLSLANKVQILPYTFTEQENWGAYYTTYNYGFTLDCHTLLQQQDSLSDKDKDLLRQIRTQHLTGLYQSSARLAIIQAHKTEKRVPLLVYMDEDMLLTDEEYTKELGIIVSSIQHTIQGEPVDCYIAARNTPHLLNSREPFSEMAIINYSFFRKSEERKTLEKSYKNISSDLTFLKQKFLKDPEIDNLINSAEDIFELETIYNFLSQEDFYFARKKRTHCLSFLSIFAPNKEYTATWDILLGKIKHKAAALAKQDNTQALLNSQENYLNILEKKRGRWIKPTSPQKFKIHLNTKCIESIEKVKNITELYRLHQHLYQKSITSYTFFYTTGQKNSWEIIAQKMRDKAQKLENYSEKEKQYYNTIISP